MSLRHLCSNTLEMFACGNGTRSIRPTIVPGGSDTWTSMGTSTPPAGEFTMFPTRPPADTLMRPLLSVFRKVVGLEFTAFQVGRKMYCTISLIVPPLRVSAAPLRLFQMDGLAVPVPGCTHL